MDLQRTRIFLLLAMFAVGLALFSAWQREYGPVPKESQKVVEEGNKSTHAHDVPALSVLPEVVLQPATKTAQSENLIDIETDVLKLKIDPLGGDIVRAELIKYPKTLNSPEGTVLLDRSTERHYIAQTGLIGKDQLGPDSHQGGRAHYSPEKSQYHLGADNELQINLHWHDNRGVEVVKTYTLQRGSYLIDVSYRIVNTAQTPWQGSFYGQIQREYTKESSNGFLGAQMYQGGAVYTPEKPFKKISFPDMKKQAFGEKIKGGWAAMVERYFLCAWIPSSQDQNHYYTKVTGENVYNIGSMAGIHVPPRSEHTFTGKLYVGPEDAETLKAISPGLNLTIDYGILWPISQLLFWLLKTINSFVHNWGWSIILVTLVVKILFYHLSATSYRSMGKMRRLQPRIEQLKERHKDDKQKFSTALMELYRKEKVNPLGGCLPILIQIPVFIALYYVLLESVELRQAPFMLWIKDLSSRDPFYVLPLIMGATMFVQQKMNPPPPDPVQAKVMLFMPVVFTALFLSFPAGLVLYWTVNNVLSILQQWYITRSLENEGTLAKNK